MSKKFDDILNECLNRMAAGEDMEQCLQDYPELSHELRLLLETASTVKAKGTSIQPRPEFKALARQRFLAEARAKAEAQRKPGWLSFYKWQHQWTFVLLAVAVVVFAGGGTAVAASSNAMPDDFLYPVKLAVEDVRMTFTGSDVDKAELEAKFASRRVNEIARMAEKGKWRKVEATAERLADHLEKIAGVAAEKKAAGELDQEDIMKLTTTLAHYATDHPLIFRKAVEQMPAKEKAVIVRVFQASKMQYAAAIEDLNIAVRASEGQSVTASAGTTTELEGVVRMIVDGRWVVGDQVVNVDDSTHLDIVPNIGTAVKVEAQYQSDGSLDARKISIRPSVNVSSPDVAPDVVRPTPAPTVETPAVKPVESPTVAPIKPSSPTPEQTPAATAVEPTANTATSKPVIPAIETPEEVIDVPEIRTFAGVIRRITKSHWNVGAYTVIISNDTVIRGDSGVGLIARVWVEVQPNGTLVAHTIWVQKIEVQSPDDSDASGAVPAEDSSGSAKEEPNVGTIDNSRTPMQSADSSNTMTDK